MHARWRTLAFGILACLVAACSSDPKPPATITPAERLAQQNSPHATPPPKAPSPQPTILPSGSPDRQPLITRLWHVGGLFTPDDGPPQSAALGEAFVLSGFADGRVQVVRRGGARGTLAFCDTDFAWKALQNSAPDIDHGGVSTYDLRSAFAECLQRTLHDERLGLVLQGPSLLAPSPDAVGRATRDAPALEVWQVVRITDVRMGATPVYRVDLGGKGGWVSAHLIARGRPDHPGLQKGQNGWFLRNTLQESAHLVDTWRIPLDFSHLEPLSAERDNIAHFDPIYTLSAAEQARLSGATRIEDLLLPAERHLERLQGTYVPLAYVQGQISCAWLPARLTLDRKGTVTFQLGAKSLVVNPKVVQAEPTGGLSFFAESPSKVNTHPDVTLRFAGLRDGNLVIQFRDLAKEVPRLFTRLSPTEEDAVETRLRYTLGCPNIKR